MKLLLLRLVFCKFKQKEQVYNASINVMLLKNSQDKTVGCFIGQTSKFQQI